MGSDQPGERMVEAMRVDAAIGSLLGTAVGDAIGLPYEGLAPLRAARMLGPPTRHRLLPGWGMVSDDTEHACAVAAAVVESGGRLPAFTRSLARRLRWWFAAMPPGTGLATAKACIRLWLGAPPERSGVRSAGNGPAMRAAILGACIDDPDQLRALVEASTLITHRDPRAFQGALAVALAARMAKEGETVDPRSYASAIDACPDLGGTEMAERIAVAAASVGRGDPSTLFAASEGHRHGVSGFILHTVPIAIHCWLSHQGDLRRAVDAAVRCGGDTDTTAAIAGGIVGAGVGPGGVPVDWLAGLLGWPRTVAWMEELGVRAAKAARSGAAGVAPTYAWYGTWPRNMALLGVVLAHGARRLLPPYGWE